jgi:phosphonatase-like hydrolase
VGLRLAVFDMVGTTVRAGDEVPSSFSEAFRSVGITLSDSAITRIRGRSKREAISELLSEHAVDPAGAGERVDEVYARFRAALQAAYRRHAQAIHGVEDVFRFLQRAEVKVVLATGLDRETAEILFNSLGWESLGLSGLVTGDDVDRGRPAPDLIFAAMRLAGVADPESVAVIGDTAADLEAAAKAEVGMGIGVLTGAHSQTQLEAHSHSAVLESVADLPRWLKEVGAL